jgi:hypothetical protein
MHGEIRKKKYWQGYGLDDPGFDSRQKKVIFPFSETPTPPLESNQAHVQ